MKNPHDPPEPWCKGSAQPNILDLSYWTIEYPPQFDSAYFLEDCHKWIENNNPWANLPT